MVCACSHRPTPRQQANGTWSMCTTALRCLCEQRTHDVVRDLSGMVCVSMLCCVSLHHVSRVRGVAGTQTPQSLFCPGECEATRRQRTCQAWSCMLDGCCVACLYPWRLQVVILESLGIDGQTLYVQASAEGQALSHAPTADASARWTMTPSQLCTTPSLLELFTKVMLITECRITLVTRSVDRLMRSTSAGSDTAHWPGTTLKRFLTWSRKINC